MKSYNNNNTIKMTNENRKYTKFKLINICALALLFTTTTASSQPLDFFSVNEPDSQDYSTDSDQPLNRDFDLRQVQKAFNDSDPKENIKRFTYDPNQIYKVKLRLHISTIIHLPKGEEILAYSLGDSGSFEVQTFENNIPNIINIRSLYAGIDSNLSIITKSGNNYSFYLRSYPVKARELPDFIVYIETPKQQPSWQFVSSNDNEIISNKQETNIIAPSSNSKYQKRLELLNQLKQDNDYLKQLDDPYKININYTMKGDEEIAPFGVYDDGTWTYFDFRKDFVSNRLPVIYKVVDGYDSIVNTRVENGFLIAESLSKSGWTLKNGDKVVCIRPKKSEFDYNNDEENSKFSQIIGKLFNKNEVKQKQDSQAAEITGGSNGL